MQKELKENREMCEKNLQDLEAYKHGVPLCDCGTHAAAARACLKNVHPRPSVALSKALNCLA